MVGKWEGGSTREHALRHVGCTPTHPSNNDATTTSTVTITGTIAITTPIPQHRCHSVAALHQPHLPIHFGFPPCCAVLAPPGVGLALDQPHLFLLLLLSSPPSPAHPRLNCNQHRLHPCNTALLQPTSLTSASNLGLPPCCAVLAPPGVGLALPLLVGTPPMVPFCTSSTAAVSSPSTMSVTCRLAAVEVAVGGLVGS